jgi:hypothetical protein
MKMNRRSHPSSRRANQNQDLRRSPISNPTGLEEAQLFQSRNPSKEQKNSGNRKPTEQQEDFDPSQTGRLVCYPPDMLLMGKKQ